MDSIAEGGVVIAYSMEEIKKNLFLFLQES